MMVRRRTATFRIEAVHPSLNVWSRSNPFKVATLKKAHARFVFAAVHAAKMHGHWDGHPFQKALVTVRYHFPTRARHDPDNATPKFYLDQLVASGVLADDDFTHLPVLTIVGGSVANPGWTEIVVEEQEAEA